MATSRNLMEAVVTLGPRTENSDNLHKGFPGGLTQRCDEELSRWFICQIGRPGLATKPPTLARRAADLAALRHRPDRDRDCAGGALPAVAGPARLFALSDLHPRGAGCRRARWIGPGAAGNG